MIILEDHAIGLSTFTIMAGLGGSLGYAMGGLDWGVLGRSNVKTFCLKLKIFSSQSDVKKGILCEVCVMHKCS